MPIDDQELRAICFLAIRVRKATQGCGPWDEPGLMTNLRKLAERNLHMTIEDVMRHAADPAAKTPGVILGSYKPKAPEHQVRTHPPRKDQECQAHPGQYASHCGGCNADRLAGDQSPQRGHRTDPTAHIAAARAAIRGGAVSVEEGL